jgi:hypothetical protein
MYFSVHFTNQLTNFWDHSVYSVKRQLSRRKSKTSRKEIKDVMKYERRSTSNYVGIHEL